MTNEEAINSLITTKVLVLSNREYEAYKTAVEMAVEALKKQCMRTPLENEFHDFLCPNCGNELGCVNYCENCGTAIDWGDLV